MCIRDRVCLVIEVDGSFLSISRVVNRLYDVFRIWRYRCGIYLGHVSRVASNDWTLNGTKRLGSLCPVIVGNNLARNVIGRVATLEVNRCRVILGS